MIENLGRVTRDALPQNPVFPGVGGRFKALQLPQNFQHAALSGELRTRSGMLPAQKPAHELRRRDRLNLLAQFADGEPVDAREQTAFAPLRLRSCGVGELAAKYGAAGFHAQQRFIDLLRRKAENFAQFRRCRGPGMRHPARDHRQHGIFLRRCGAADIGQGICERSCAKNLPEDGRAFRAHPICSAVSFGACRTVLPDQFIEIRLPWRKRFGQSFPQDAQSCVLRQGSLHRFRQGDEREERVVQLIGIAHIRPCVAPHFIVSRRIKPAQFRCERFRQRAAHIYGARAALLERRIVEIGVRIGVQNFVREGRRHRRIHREALDVALDEISQDAFQAIDIERLGEHILHRLAHQWMIGNGDITDDIFLAGQCLRKNGRQQVFGAHSLNLRSDFLSALKTQQRERAARGPAPAHREKRRGEHSLFQNLLHGSGKQITENIGERETVLLAKGNIQTIIGGSGLQLEIEGTAKLFSQRQTPGFIDARAEGRVDHQLHAAAFVKKTLGNNHFLRRHGSQHGDSGQNVLDDLLRAGIVEAALRLEPFPRARRRRFRAVSVLHGHMRGDFFAQPRNLRGKLRRPRGCFATPKGNAGRRALRIFDEHAAGLNAPDAPGGIAQQHDVAGEALDGKIFVHGSDRRVVRRGHDAVERILRDRSAAGDRGEAASAASFEAMVHAIAEKIGAVTAAPRGDAFREHFHDGVEIGARQSAIGIGAANQFVEIVLAPLFRGAGGHDLLRQHVERVRGNLQPVQLAGTHAAHYRRAFHELIERGREDATLGNRAAPVAGAADALQGHGNRPRRANLANQIHVADVDAQLQRRRRDEHAHFAGFQLAFRGETQLAREAAVMRRHGLFPQALGQMVRHALGKPPRIDEHQRGTMLQDERGDAVVNLTPHLVGGDRPQFALGHFDSDVHAPAVARIHDHRCRAVTPGKKLRKHLDGLLRGGKADADRRAREKSFEPLERKRQMRAAFIVGDGMDFIHDHRFDIAQDGAAALGRQKDIERFRRGDENMRRPHQHFAAFVHQGVASAHADADFGHQQATFGGFTKNFAQRELEIFLDVVAQRLQRRDV